MGIDTAAKKVQINKLVRSQVPSFVAEDNPLFIDFLKQYYISEEAKGKSIDIISNFNDYQKADTYSETYNLIGFTSCTSLVNSYDATINVLSTDGWPSDYGLFKIDDEIITYTGITSTSFTGCVRGFCGVDNLKSSTDPESLVFSSTNASKHENNSRVINLSNLFLQEFWEKTKKLFLPGFEDRKLDDNIDKANFLRQAKDFYSSKGTDEAIKILFGVLFDSRAEVIKPIEYLFAPSDADYVKTNDLMAERISGNAQNVVGQTLFQTDAPATSGSIFNVQYAPRDGRDYYIISLSKGSIVGTFEPTGSSSLVTEVGIGSTVVTVDSTLGFPEKGELYVGAGLTVGIATYTSKTSTQFFGVSGISSNYSDSDFVRSSKTVFAYENGDVSKPVFFRLTNVATDVNLDNIGFLQVDDIIKPRQLGKITDPANHQVNSWIDNIKTKIDVARDIRTSTSKVNSNSSVITTAAPHFLTPNDSVIIIDVTEDDQSPDNIVGTVERVINDLEFQINISSGVLNPTKIYKVQRQLNFATSTNNELGVSNFIADIQNTYISEDNKQVYVTAGSLPSYEIKANNRKKSFTSAASIFNSNVDGVTNNIKITNHKFVNGELVRYITSGTNQVVGLDTGSIYAVKKIDEDTIQLARSIPDIATNKVISITGIGSTTTHELIPSVLYEKNIKHQNFLRRFPISPEPSEYDDPLQTDPVGMFVNGVEILSNRSGDSVHFGNIRRIDVESGGKDYDIISPPNIHISDTVGTGATAYAVIEGNFKGIDILSGGYDIKTVPNVVITGGNGSGATAQARLKATRNSRLFDAKDNVNDGDDTITFLSNHLFFDGETVIYEKSATNNVVGGLVNKSIYYVHKISDTQISLMTNFEDAVAGINTVDLTSTSIGSHKFTSTTFRNVLDKIYVDNPGSGYSNRKILVDSNEYPSPTYFTREDLRSGISSANNYIYFENHGFKSGEIVEYKIVGVGSTAISGLSTNYSYYVNRLDENKFRLSYAGVKGGRTNIISHSEEIDKSAGAHLGNFKGILTADSPVTTPNGGTKSYVLTGDGTNGHHNIRVHPGQQDGQAVGLKTDTHYVFSTFVKKFGNHRYVRISPAGTSDWVNPDGQVTLDLDTGVVDPGAASHAYGAIPYPNGWYRMWWEDKTETSGSRLQEVTIVNAGSGFSNGTTTNVTLIRPTGQNSGKATVTVTGGSVTLVTVTSGGDNYRITDENITLNGFSGVSLNAAKVDPNIPNNRGWYISLAANIGGTVTGTYATTNGVYIWGLQAEEVTNYPTEYIPTNGAPKTVDTVGSVSDYFIGKYVDIGSNIGFGCTHIFKYPDINVELKTLSGEPVSAISQPIVRPLCHGSITDVFLTSFGENYGSSDTINAHRRPLVQISNGTNALITVGVTNGQITGAFVKIKGKGYVSPPELIVEGEGRYARLISSVASDGTLSGVSIIDSGKDYTEQPATTVRIKQQGSGAVFRADLKQWTNTTLKRYQKNIDQDDDGIMVPSQNPEYEAKFASVYLPRKLRLQLKDNIEIDGTGSLSELTQLKHSPIVGWAYDGAPIYGPYGYSSPTGGTIQRLTSSYTPNLKSNRPSISEFELGSFIEDYDYTADGHLDKYNGRFGKTPEFPDGVYAYFCTMQDADGSVSPFIGSREPTFPYILNGFKFRKVEMNGQPLSLQNMPILNSGSILRNTYPYKLGFVGSDYDYLVSNNIEDTELLVKTITTSGIGSVNILSTGSGYKVNDRILFNNSESGGRGASAKVKTLVGKGITQISYNQTTVDDIVFDFRNGMGIGIAATSHGLQNNDLVNISGIDAGGLKFLEGPKTIAISSITSNLVSVGLGTTGVALPMRNVTGDTTFITLSDVLGGKSKDDDIQVGDYLTIGSLINDASIHERVKVLEVDNIKNRYKILRDSGISTYFSDGESVSVDQKRFTFSIGINTNFNIKKNKEVVFNPQSTIGIGTVLVTVPNPIGTGNVQVARVVANDGTVLPDHEVRSGLIGDDSISIPNHGFFTGQKLKYSSGSGAALKVSNFLNLSSPFRLTEGQFVYAVKKSNDVIGITTTQVGSATTSLYITRITTQNDPGNDLFHNREDHSFKTTNKEYVGSLDRYNIVVDTPTPHELRTNDRITVDIAPNTLVNKTIEYDTIARKLIVDPQYVNSSNVFTSSSQIKIVNHGYKDGDKVLYSLTGAATPIWPLVDRGEYYVKRINKNRFRLFDNRNESISIPSGYIKITGAGTGVHRFARINPPIKALKGQTIGFAVSDPSLTNLQLQFYKDKNFTNKFDGVGISTEIVRTGVAGTTGSVVNVKLTDNLQLPLWYKLVPSSLNAIDVSKRDSEPDDQVVNGSKIVVDVSEYGGNFGIKTTGISSFTYQVADQPEATSYVTSGVTTFRYLTSSLNATGGINEIKVDFAGKRYIKNPGINRIKTTSGRNADIRMFDPYIGKAGHKEIVKIGYDYPTDKSLTPRADTPVTVTVKNNFVIGHIGINTAGKNYSTAPDLFLPDRPNAETEVTLEGTGIGSIRILNDSLTGFDLFPNPPEIYAVNNSNGVGVVTAISNGVTQTITLKAPVGGWRPANHVLGTNFPFKEGDEIFVENVNIQGHPVIDPAGQETFPEPLPSTDPRTYPENEAQGYNSNMYGYRTFKVLPFQGSSGLDNINTSRIQYTLTGIGTTGGFFDPLNSAGRVIKKDDLPTFNVRFDHRDFINGEPITFGDGGAEGQIVKNEGWDRATNSFRIEKLSRTPYIGDVIKGKISRAQGKVVQSSFHEKYFKLNYNAEREKGWQKNTGKPSSDFQKLQDSDYYQNFSYSIQSEVQEKEFTDAVDSIVHPSGFKNFSDLVIKSNATAGFARSTTLTARSPQSATDLKVDIDNVASFYVQNDFDFATETTIRNGLSKFITFQNRKIRDLLSISTAKVELMDDISGQFNAKTETFSGVHIFKSATGNGITIISGGSGTLTATTGTSYQAYSGILTIVTTTNHNLNSGAKVRLANNSLVFTCDKDNHSTLHPYPRSSDPASGADLTVTVVNATTFTVVTNTPIVGGQIVGLSSFRLTSQSGAVPLYYKLFDPNDSSIVSVGSSVITIFNHGFQTGERIRYLPHNHGAEGYGNNRIGIVTTNHVIGGATTDFMPEEMFVVSKLDNNRFKVAGLSTTGTTESLTLRQFPYSLGTDHAFESLNTESRSLIQIDGMIQSPLTNRSVNLDLIDQVGVGSTTLKLQAGVFGGNAVGLTTVKLNDIIQIDDEFMRVKTVGFGSTNVVSVDRGFLGSGISSHTASATPKMKGGNFRIDKGVVYFATPPFGPTGTTGVTTSSTFSGRVFNRRDVTRNFVFDDISHLFTGENNLSGKMFTLKQNGSDVTGIVTTTSGTGGSGQVINYGVILINGIFQRPIVDYDITPIATPSLPSTLGIGGSIFFTGNDLFDLPRGGKVDEVDPVALGQNYQPRIRAGATAVVNGSGVITGVNMLSAGSGYFSGSVNIEVQNPLGTGTPAVLAATVGTGSSAGMITGINVTSGGSGYNAQFPPVIKVGIATGYTNLSATGGSGNGLKLDARVGSSGSIIDFNITDRGFSYKNGEVLTVQGIPFRAGVSTSPFTLTVKSTIDDKFAGFSFGQLVPLDDFSSEFNSVKKSFLLTKTNITKDVVTIASLDTSIDPANNLLIFLNDVLQQPKQNYTLEGGTVVKFVEAPREGSKLQLLFFRGGNQDIESINPIQTVKVGDKLSLLRDLDVPTQTDRVISEISDISKVETPPYGGGGISTNPDLVRVISWKKQDKDLIIDGLPIAKDRSLQVGNFYPSARLIRSVGLGSAHTYVDNAYPFFSAYDNRTDNDRVPGEIEIINTQEIKVARAEAVVSVGGTIESINIVDGGSGYENVPSVSIAKFNKVQSGISTLLFENNPLIQEVGNSWNAVTPPLEHQPRDVDYIPEGVFVSVGATAGIITSTDGNNWSVSSVTGPTSRTFTNVVGLSSEVVIVGTAGTIVRSTNAASSFTGTQIYDRIQTGFIPTYSPRNLTQTLNGVAVGSYIFPGISTTIAQERVVAVGAAGTIVYSEPGSSGLTTSFVISNKFADQTFHDVDYHDGTFIAVGAQGSIYRSTDGETWSGVTTTSITTTLRGIHYGEDQWIAVGAASSVISSTDDGLNWSVVSDNTDIGVSFTIEDVHYKNNVWLAVGGSTGATINSINGKDWFFDRIPNTPQTLRGMTYGDNKMVAVGGGISYPDAIRWSGYETVGAAATATVGAGGTISAITVNNGGFGYKFGTTPTVLISQEVVSREIINTVNVSGDYGTVVGVAVSSSGVNNKPSLNLTLDSDAFLNQGAFNNPSAISKTNLSVGDYFVLKNTVFGNGVTSIDKDDNNVGVGTSFADNIYKVEEVFYPTNDNTLAVVFCNISSINGITPITMSGATQGHRKKLGNYSWGKLTNLGRNQTQKVFNINNTNGYTGITTAPEVRRINPLSVSYDDFTVAPP